MDKFMIDLSKELILALDSGTTSARAILFDREGNVIFCAQREIKQSYPKPGYVEEDAEEIYNASRYCVREAVKFAADAGMIVAAMGITNQRETAILWEAATGKPVYPAIVWQCRRSADICDELKTRGYETLVHEKTGLIIDAYFSATKLRWLFEEKPELLSRAKRGELLFGTVDTYLMWRLTGGRTFKTDVTNASRTMLFNIRTLSWDKALISLFNIPEIILPEVCETTSDFGITAIAETGAQISITAVAGDQQAALFGQRCFDAGSAKCTYGTGCFLLVNTGERIVSSNNKLLSGIAWTIGKKTSYCLEGSVFSGGSAIKWLRDGLKLISSSPEIDRRAAKTSGGVYFVPAFSGLGAPHWKMDARGIFCGISAGTTDAHICRAVLEAIAYQVEDILKCVRSDCAENKVPLGISELKADGGASVSEPLMQFQADISRLRVICPKKSEKTAEGISLLARLGAGLCDFDTLKTDNGGSLSYEPEMSDDEAYRLLLGWENAVSKA